MQISQPPPGAVQKQVPTDHSHPIPQARRALRRLLGRHCSLGVGKPRAGQATSLQLMGPPQLLPSSLPGVQPPSQKVWMMETETEAVRARPEEGALQHPPLGWVRGA